MMFTRWEYRLSSVLLNAAWFVGSFMADAYDSIFVRGVMRNK